MPVASFTPRKEFIRSDAVGSSFSLLSFASTSLVRLSNFPPSVVKSIHTALEPNVRGFREDNVQGLYEIALNSKPWSVPKSVDSERLVVQILGIVFSQKFCLLSTIDYGREPDDKLCLVFSRPNDQAPPNDFPPSSSTSLPRTTTVTFAVSFPSTTSLRVLCAPLHATPAILQALRTAWPRGVSGEKKIADSSYEFKLKGYSILREDTFPTDSLNHTLNLLSSLDSHGFSLVASLSINGSHHRVKDLWIFTGQDELSEPTSPDASTQNVSHSNGHSITSSSDGRHGAVAADAAGAAGLSAFAAGHAKSATAPAEIENPRERVQSEALSTTATVGSPGLMPKHTVLKKKHHTDKKDSMPPASPRQDHILLVGENLTGDNNRPQHVPALEPILGRGIVLHDDQDTPARVLYSSTSRQQTIGDNKQFVEQDHAAASNMHQGDTTLAATEAGTLGIMGVGTLTAMHHHAENQHKALLSSEPEDSLMSHPSLSPPTAAAEVPPPPPTSDRSMEKRVPERPPQISMQSDELLGSRVFRNTFLTEPSSSSQVSADSTPAADSTLTHHWHSIPEDVVMAGAGAAALAAVPMMTVDSNRVPEPQSAQITPKQPIISLPSEYTSPVTLVQNPHTSSISSSFCPPPPALERGDTQMTTPIFPGAWAPTPAHELDHSPLNTLVPPPKTSNAFEPNPARKSEFGIIGSVPSAADESMPTNTMNPHENPVEQAASVNRTLHEPTIVTEHLDAPSDVLAREEAKLPPLLSEVMEKKEADPTPSAEPPTSTTEGVPTDSTKEKLASAEPVAPSSWRGPATSSETSPSKNPSVLKKLFNRSSRRNSKQSVPFSETSQPITSQS